MRPSRWNSTRTVHSLPTLASSPAFLLGIAVALVALNTPSLNANEPATPSARIQQLLDAPHLHPSTLDALVLSASDADALIAIASADESLRRRARAVAALAFVPVTSAEAPRGDATQPHLFGDKVQRFLRDKSRSPSAASAVVVRAAEAAVARASRVEASAAELERLASSPHPGAVEVAIRQAFRRGDTASASAWARGNDAFERLMKRLSFARASTGPATTRSSPKR